jgi:hypothetical protein
LKKFNFINWFWFKIAREGNVKAFSCPFLLAAVQFPFIGVDFLFHHGLLVDMAGNQLVDRLTLCIGFHSSPPLSGDLPLQARLSSLFSGPVGPLHKFTGLFPSPGVFFNWGLYRGLPASSHQLRHGFTSLHAAHRPLLKVASLYNHLQHAGRCLRCLTYKSVLRSLGMSWEVATCSIANMNSVSGLQNDFLDAVNASKALQAAVHGVKHHIMTIGPPIASRFWRLEGAKLEAARKDFEAMEQEGIIERSTSP